MIKKNQGLSMNVQLNVYFISNNLLFYAYATLIIGHWLLRNKCVNMRAQVELWSYRD